MNPTRAACTPLFLLVLMSASPASQAAEALVRLSPRDGAVDAVFAKYDSTRTPGCNVAVMEGDRVLLKKSYGMADPSLGVPMTSSTTMWIPYSEARVFVALAVAMLAKEGKLALDDTVRQHVPQVPAYASAVTIRQLLHHTSGFADYGVLGGPAFNSMETRVSEDEFFRILTRWGKLGFAPGQGYMYSNTDYALLQMVVERVSGGTLHDYLHAKLLRPLGMNATRIGADQSVVAAGHALFHEPAGDGFRKVLAYRTSPVGGISVTTSLDDLIRWNRALRNSELGLMTLLKQLEAGAPASQAPSDGAGYAFGIYRRTHRGVPLLEYHGLSGYHYLVQVPGTQFSVATLCNAYVDMSQMAAEVARLYVGPDDVGDGKNSAMPALPVPAPALAPPVTIAVAELRRYLGEYRSANGQAVVDVTLVDGALAITPRGAPSFPQPVALGGGQFRTVLGNSTFLLAFKQVDEGMTLSSWDVTRGESGGPELRRWTPPALDSRQLAGYPGTYVGDDVEVVLHVRVVGDKVMLASRGYAESALVPQGVPDRFMGPDIYTARFERDGAGRVIGLVLDASRVKGIRFTRQKHEGIDVGVNAGF